MIYSLEMGGFSTTDAQEKSNIRKTRLKEGNFSYYQNYYGFDFGDNDPSYNEDFQSRNCSTHCRQCKNVLKKNSAKDDPTLCNICALNAEASQCRACKKSLLDEDRSGCDPLDDDNSQCIRCYRNFKIYGVLWPHRKQSSRTMVYIYLYLGVCLK